MFQLVPRYFHFQIQMYLLKWTENKPWRTGITYCLRAHESVILAFLARVTEQGGKYPDSKVHGANMGPIWVRQDPGGLHVGPMNFAIWVNTITVFELAQKLFAKTWHASFLFLHAIINLWVTIKRTIFTDFLCVYDLVTTSVRNMMEKASTDFFF